MLATSMQIWAMYNILILNVSHSAPVKAIFFLPANIVSPIVCQITNSNSVSHQKLMSELIKTYTFFFHLFLFSLMLKLFYRNYSLPAEKR